ncbi:enolase C-terminal domain-like protein [Halobellus sp. GM3]|uniref:enolase C-terminal domain-like protein n=1 Tax=Halobellus sp. GM3 TaxID=3458410 RepID=UPI00403E12F4
MDFEPFSLRVEPALETGAGRIEQREGYVVRTERAGVIGVGEATPLPGWTESRDECEAALDGVRDRANAGGTGEILDRVERATPAARHGVELAAVDAESRAAGEPLAAFLSESAPAGAVPVNATVGDGGIDATVRAAREAVEAGYEAIKIKVGARAPAVDANRIRAVRDVAGDAVELRADANGSLDERTAERLLDVAAELDFAYVEQPLPPDDLRGHAALRGRGVDIALDESLAALGPDAVLAAGAADVLVGKPMALGGPVRTLDVARRAAAENVATVVTTTVDAVVARVGALHVAAAIPEVPACGLATGSLLADDLAPDPAPVEGGTMSVPAGPGLAGDAFDELRRQ